MSRKNRFFKASQAMPQSSMPPLIRTLTGLSSLLPRDGTMIGQTQQAEGNPQAMETISQSETVPATSTSGTKSEPSLADRMLFWRKRQADIPTFNIIGTQCCGLHSLSGFQRMKDWDSVMLVLSVQKSYKKNDKEHQRVAEANSAFERAFFAQTEEKQAETPFVYPYPNFIGGPKNIAGMLLFTWNHDVYHESAKKVAKFIKDNGLGVCSFTEPAYNPNSHNTIRAMVWSVDRNGYASFIEKAGVNFD